MQPNETKHFISDLFINLSFNKLLLSKYIINFAFITSQFIYSLGWGQAVSCRASDHTTWPRAAHSDSILLIILDRAPYYCCFLFLPGGRVWDNFSSLLRSRVCFIVSSSCFLLFFVRLLRTLRRSFVGCYCFCFLTSGYGLNELLVVRYPLLSSIS